MRTQGKKPGGSETNTFTKPGWRRGASVAWLAIGLVLWVASCAATPPVRVAYVCTSEMSSAYMGPDEHFGVVRTPGFSEPGADFSACWDRYGRRGEVG